MDDQDLALMEQYLADPDRAFDQAYDLNGDGKVTEADLEKLIGLIDGNYSLGDVNHSGTVDDADAELLYQFLQGNGTKEEADALGLDLDVANLNRDDRVDWNDYDSLMQYIAQ